MQREFIRMGAQNVVYDGVDLSDIFNITDFVIGPFPTRTAKTVKVPGQAGTTFLSIDEGERTVKMKLSIKGNSRNPMVLHRQWQDLNPVLLKDEPKPLYCGGSRFLNAIVTEGGDFTRKGFRGVADVTFLAPDPYFYGADQEVELIAGINDFEVLGEGPIWPTFELTGVTGALEVENVATGDKIVIPSVASADKTVVIDTGRRRCLVDGSYLPVDLDETEWFFLPYGGASIRVSAGSGTVRYRERYR